MYTESEIKRHLDGSFWFFDQDGKLHHKFVDVDFVPNHFGKLPYGQTVDARGVGSNGYHIEWPENAFEVIDQMREDGMTWQMIGQVFGASQSATTEFYKKCQKKKQLQEDQAHYEIRSREVGRMLRAGWNHNEIAQETGYSLDFIKSVASRLRRGK